MIRRILTGCFSKQPPKINEDDAISIAKSEWERTGWPFIGVVKVQNKTGFWIVQTNWGSRGGVVKVYIDKKSGEIVSAKFMPR